MTDPIVATHQYLLTHYGPLLTLKHLAEIMHSTPGALRMAISRKRQPLTAALAATRRRVGRRIYFEARQVAEIIVQDEGIVTPIDARPKVTADDNPSHSEHPHQGEDRR